MFLNAVQLFLTFVINIFPNPVSPAKKTGSLGGGAITLGLGWVLWDWPAVLQKAERRAGQKQPEAHP